MPCFKPLQAWLLPNATTMPDGTVKVKNKVAFKRADREYFDISKGVDLPCGQCIGCRLERSRRWAVRIMHEAQLHEQNSFLTLTYASDKLPENNTIVMDDVQRFIKRLRKRVGKIRYFQCGEYGEKSGRPHYHMCLFGYDFSGDRVPFHETDQGHTIYTSDLLTEEWGLGHASIGELTFDSAAYVARYCLKKVTGDKKDEHYKGRTPEFVSMSRRPGIGADWYKKFSSDVYPSDECIMNGKSMMPPPFYDKLLEKTDPLLYNRIKREREKAAAENASSDDSRSRRLLDRETVKLKTVRDCLPRSIE